MCDKTNQPLREATADGVGDGVAVPGRHWYVAVVGHNTERACRDRLALLGYEAYVATQAEERVWRNGRKKRVERVVITNILFVHATEQERRDIVNQPYVKYYLTDKASDVNEFGTHQLAIIPDEQMRRLQFMLYNASQPVTFAPGTLRVGDRITIQRGPLQGLDGNIVRLTGTTRLAVRIDALGYALINLTTEEIKLKTEPRQNDRTATNLKRKK